MVTHGTLRGNEIRSRPLRHLDAAFLANSAMVAGPAAEACPVGFSERPQSGAVASHGGKHVGKGIAQALRPRVFWAQRLLSGNCERQTLRRKSFFLYRRSGTP